MRNHERACDRCHKYKERCIFGSKKQLCINCESSGSFCTTLRPERRRGRRPSPKLLGPGSWIHLWETRDLTTVVAGNLANVEVPAIPGVLPAPDFTAHNARSTAPYPFDSSPGILERFAAKYDIFMISPSFASQFRLALQYAYSCAPVLLHEIFTVIFPPLKYGRHYTSEWKVVNTIKGAEALRRLRGAQVIEAQVAFAVIVLGQSLAAFELLTNCVSSTTILRYSLSLAQPWHKELSMDALSRPATLAPVFWDTVSCLVSREIPVIRLSDEDSLPIDLATGLCTPLLPIFFDLCLVSNALKNQNHTTPKARSSLDILKCIEQRLWTWVPQIPSTQEFGLTEQEMLVMLAQASMHRAAGLLISHRIAHPFGALDSVAISYANTILLELFKFSPATGSNPSLPFITLPILMAAFEVPNIPDDIWDRVKLLQAAPVCTMKLRRLVQYVWEKRTSGFTGYVFDLIDSGPEFVMVP